MIAVIKTGGKQYKVSEGDIIEVDKLDAKEGPLTFEEVLLVVSDENVQIGKPFISDVKVSGKLLEQKKGEKIRVAKYKSKVRYRRVTGFRAQLSKVQIEKIEPLKGKTAEKASTVKKTAKKS